MADEQYTNSRCINQQLLVKVRSQQSIFESVELSVKEAKADVKKLNNAKHNDLLAKVMNELGTSEKANVLETIQ